MPPPSHLLQMRGLKPRTDISRTDATAVASFTDAWIETKEMRHQYRSPKVASFTDAWIETLTGAAFSISAGVASFTDAWIETPF